MARLLEFEAKDLLRKTGIPVPPGGVAVTPEEAVAAAEKIGFPVVLKAQVPVGKRGKAGGILFAENSGEVLTRARELFGKNIYGALAAAAVRVAAAMASGRVFIEPRPSAHASQ